MFFIWGTTLLSPATAGQPALICDNLRNTGLFIWFVISYVFICLFILILLTVVVGAVFFLVQTSIPELKETDEQSSPLTHQQESNSKIV